jgi:hypothetical protein
LSPHGTSPDDIFVWWHITFVWLVLILFCLFLLLRLPQWSFSHSGVHGTSIPRWLRCRIPHVRYGVIHTTGIGKELPVGTIAFKGRKYESSEFPLYVKRVGQGRVYEYAKGLREDKTCDVHPIGSHVRSTSEVFGRRTARTKTASKVRCSAPRLLERLTFYHNAVLAQQTTPYGIV